MIGLHKYGAAGDKDKMPKLITDMLGAAGEVQAVCLLGQRVTG